MAALFLVAVAHSGPAISGDGAGVARAHSDNAEFGAPARAPSLSASLQVIPAPFHVLELSDEPKLFSTQDFRPRGASFAEMDPAAKDSSYHGSAWDRLSDYRFHNRVRLITLWETRGSSLSLQAGHRGGPTLQWTSGLTDRAPTGHGVLDRLFSTTVESAPHNVPLSRQPAPEAPARSSKTLDALAGYGAAK